MNVSSLTDARTAVANSGVIDWAWGTDDDYAVVDRHLPAFIRQEASVDRIDDDEFHALVARFITEKLGQKPADYGL